VCLNSEVVCLANRKFNQETPKFGKPPSNYYLKSGRKSYNLFVKLLKSKDFMPLALWYRRDSMKKVISIF